MEIEEGSASTCLMVWDTASDWSKSNFSSTTHAVDGLIDPNPNQIPVREIGWHTCIFMKSCWKPLVSLMSGLKIRDAIPQQKCIFFNILLGLVSKRDSEDRNSRCRLEAWDWKEEILNLVLKHLVLRVERGLSHALSLHKKCPNYYVSDRFWGMQVLNNSIFYLEK